jgi:chemotaxis protein methyltransferase CheR
MSGTVSARDYAFSDEDFGTIAAIAKAEYGLNLEPSKKALVYSRLTRRLRARGLRDFRQYCRLIADKGEAAERQAMLSALTTNVTHFFREEHHFEQLSREVLPDLVARARQGGRVRLWSAGCSSGEEPFSIALCLLACCPEAPRLDIRILASDVDAEVLERANAGLYPERDFKGLSPARASALFEPGSTPASIRPDLRRLVSFRALNLMEDWPMKGQFDVIFCRNVAIYFDAPTQQRLWQRLADRLGPGGFLCIGHSERLAGSAAGAFESVGITAYRKRGAPAAD